MKTIWNGMIRENPIFVLMLGLCPTLAVTNKFESAYMMGICVFFILLFSEFLISLIRKWIPNSVKIPVCVIIIGTFVTIVELLLYKYIPNLYKSFGFYLPLVVVNCIVLGRCMAVASRESVWKSNTLTIMNDISSITGYRLIYRIFPPNEMIPISFLANPAGAFFVLGLLMAFFQGRRKEWKQ